MKALRIILLLCLVWMTVSCVELLDHEELERNAPKLKLRFYIPSGQDPGTKTVNPLTTSSTKEYTLYDIQVWAFDHNATRDTLALAYGRVTHIQGSGQGWVDNNEYEMTLSFPYYLTTRDSLRVDFYVLGNGNSIGIGDLSNARRSQIDSLGFGKGATTDPFGPAEPVLDLEAGVGLPFSGYFNGPEQNDRGYNISFLQDSTTWSNTWQQNQDSIPPMYLTRAISKINFIFSQPLGVNATITRITLDPNQIPDSTFVFPQNDLWKESKSYGTQETILQGENGTLLSNINTSENPASWAGKDLSFLLEAVKNNQASLVEIYLRESDKTSIKGTIHYTIEGLSGELSKPFELSSSNGTSFSFSRNHCWTIYGYFQGNSIQTAVTHWDYWRTVVE